MPNSPNPGQSPLRRRWLYLGGLLTAAMLVGAWFFVEFLAGYGDSIERRALLAMTSTATVALDYHLVDGLHGSSEDENSPALLEVRRELKGIHAAIPNARYVYLMALRNDEVIFLAEAPDSADDIPGEVYTEASPDLRQVFVAATGAVEGPLPDRWGVWVSGFAPVLNPDTGKLVAVLGVDISAENWEASVARFRWLGIAIIGFLAGVIVLFGTLLFRQHMLSASLATALRIVENSTTILYRLSGGRSLPLTYISSNVARLGYRPDEFLARTGFHHGLVHPEDLPIIDAANRRLIEADGEVEPISIRIRAMDGSYRWFENRVKAIRDKAGRILLAEGMLIDIQERKQVGDQLASANAQLQVTLRRAQRHLETVALVGQADELLSGDVEKLAREVAELGARASGCERVGVWLFNEARDELRCIELYEAIPNRHSDGMVLREQDFRHELEVLKASKVVAADDAVNDPRTSGYAETYLKPLHITAMLDCMIRASGNNLGLLCFEYVDKPHHWEPDEITFASQLADRLGLALLSRMRSEAEAELRQRDALLHVVSACASELVTAPSLDKAMHTSLESISKALHVDRMSVFERVKESGTLPILRYVWHAPESKIILDAKFVEELGIWGPQLAEWQLPLDEGKIVSTQVNSAHGDVKTLLQDLGIKSLLLVPIFVDGKLWGQVGLDDCQQERLWPGFAVDILRTFSNMVGTAIQRDRYVKELIDANRIVLSTPTILYRLRGEPALPLVYISQNVRLFGYEPLVLVTSPELYKSLIHPADIAGFREAMGRILEDNSGAGVVEFRVLTSSGAYRWVENRYTPIRDDGGRLLEIEGLLIDVTERKAADERISLLARTDPLTGLANRTTFIDRLHHMFASARRGSQKFAVFYLDLDHFKDINDTLGHPTGDKLLIAAAERIKSSCRAADLVSRFGGDEFSVLQTDLSEASDAGLLAEKIRAALAVPISIDGNDLRITASIGISIYEPDTVVPEDLMAQADVALYRAKEEGRDQYRFHTGEIDSQVRDEVALTEELRIGISHDQLKLYYQPQVELGTGRIVGMEALIRWNHPTRGLLSPSAFLPVAERTGAIVAIGQWALDHACGQMSEWREAGIAPQTIAVNVSSVQLKAASEFVQLVVDTLAKWHLQPKDLELDVTESMLARAAMSQSDVLGRLQALGVNISIDDFGSKYSTLDYLKTYQVNRVKIPRVLISSAARDPKSAAMVRAIFGIARELDIEVIAQGVESAAQWSFLAQASSATQVQGYYYSEPVPPERAQSLLQQGRIVPTESQDARIGR